MPEPRDPQTTPPAAKASPTDAISAARSPRAWLVLVLVTAVCLWVDLATKYWAFRSIADVPVTVDRQQVLDIAANQGPRFIALLIPRHDPVVVIPSVLEFTLVLNPGAVFGIGPGKRTFFIVFTLIALAGGVLLFATMTRARDWWAHSAVAMLIAGGVGNLYDRLFYGCVRDFIHPLPGVKWPFGISTPWSGREVWPYVSNVADLFLIIGIGLLAVYLWRQEPPPARPSADTTSAPEPTGKA
jgi:signal peptidase II